MVKTFYRNVYEMPNGKLYIPLNLHDSIEEAKANAKDQLKDPYDARIIDKYKFTIVVDLECINLSSAGHSLGPDLPEHYNPQHTILSGD